MTEPRTEHRRRLVAHARAMLRLREAAGTDAEVRVRATLRRLRPTVEESVRMMAEELEEGRRVLRELEAAEREAATPTPTG